MEATVNKQQQLQQMLRFQQIKQLSSQQQNDKCTYLFHREQKFNRSYYRKPIKNTYSDQQSDDSSIQSHKKGVTPLPPKPVKAKSLLQQAQEEMKWTKQDTTQIDLLSKLEGNGMKDKKIRELANKFKTLNIAYEKQKTIRRNLQQQLNATMKANQEAKKNQEQTRQSLQKTSSKPQSSKCSNCAEQQKKIMDFRLKLQNMKTDLNKAHRLISKEIGENVDIDHALSQENGWKGRQQKIQKLKSRVKQLQQKLASNGVNVSHMSGFTQVSNLHPQQPKTNQFSSTQRTSSLADNKRKQLQNLKVQVQALRSQNDLLQGKVKSLTSRKITLQSQMKELKAQFEKKRQIFIQKSDNDDRFITLLKQQNQKLKKDQRVVTKIVYKQSKENTEESQALKRQIDNLRKKVKELQRANQELQSQQTQQAKRQQKTAKTINETRQISAQRKKQLQEQYLKGNKYLKKLSAEDEQQIYRAWKQSKNKI